MIFRKSYRFPFLEDLSPGTDPAHHHPVCSDPPICTTAEAEPQPSLRIMCTTYIYTAYNYLPICRAVLLYTVIRPPIDARAFVSPPLKPAIITGHLMFLLSSMAFYDLNDIYRYYINVYYYFYFYYFFFLSSCDVVVSACHLPLDFGSKNPSPFVGRRFVRNVAVSALLTTHNARYIIIIIIISCRRIPPRPTPSPYKQCRGAYFQWFFFPDFFFLFLFCRPEQSTTIRYGGIPICKRRRRPYEFSVPIHLGAVIPEDCPNREPGIRGPITLY